MLKFRHCIFVITLCSLVIHPTLAQLPDPSSQSVNTQTKAKTFIDYFLPTPPHGELSSNVWGASNVLPRDNQNGLEDTTIKQYCYWDGQIIKASDGKYHMFASRWNESSGHNGWFGSVAVHAVSDSLLGPYVDKGICWPDEASGRGHNVTALTLPDGRYAVVISETRPTEVYVSKSLDGPWEHLGTITVEGEPGWHGSNVSIMARPDGNFEFTQRDGRIMFSDKGILGPYKAQGGSVWPKGIPNLEDPCIWYSGGLYHILVNSWSTRKAYHLTSPDGINNWTNRGLAYDPREAIVRYPDGTVNRWNKLERPSVYIENGQVVAMTFAAIDVEKEQDKGNDGHGSKVIIVPFDGEALSRLEYTASKPSNIEVEAAELIGGAFKVTDNTASGGNLVSLTKSGEGIKLTNVPAGSKLAIRYASMTVGTISIAVNDKPMHNVNIHSSGALNGSFLHAVIDVEIPANATVTISLAADDVPVNIDQVLVGDGDLGLPPDIWNLPPLKVADGPYSADWKEISRVYTVPQWWRDAKFGAWSHWDPQSMPEQGDWYARGMYIQGNAQYNFHTSNFGPPSEYGYKDICNNWVIDKWDPNELMDLYVEMGVRYFMAMGVHHDNFDCWDSAYQPWNSVDVGPKVDVVGTWEKVARQHDLRFGIGFHHSPGRTWGQFMPARYTSDRTGPKQGVPYDALQTILDGKGKWWEGLDPVDLYGPQHTIARGRRSPENDPLLSPFANQFMWRVDDAITKYHPDIIYFDEHAGDSQSDLGVNMGLGFLAPPLAANYYNKSLQWNGGKMEAVLNLKGVGGRYNSFQNSPELLPYVDRSLVKSTEAIIEPEIMAYSFQTETTIADWHYKTGQRYKNAKELVGLLMENVCRNGTMLLNLTQHGRGDLDPEVTRIAKDIGAWLKVNGEAVYSSRPFEVYGEGSVRYTRNNGNVYVTLLDWQGGSISMKALHAGGATIGKVTKVEMLGSDVEMTFVQDDHGLTVTPEGTVQSLSGIENQQLASRCRVLRITHDKGWFNDDDPGATYVGWSRRCNPGTGDFNNDLTISNTTGDVWSCSFTGSSITVLAPKETGAGKIEIQIDGKTHATADLSTTGARQVQQTVFEVTDLIHGKHTIQIINRGSGPVALDALVVR